MTKLIQCAKGHNTRAALKANGINQGELANLLGVHPTSVSQWCFHGVSKKYATEVAELLSVPVGTITSKKRSSKVKAALRNQLHVRNHQKRSKSKRLTAKP
jgi:DNA-binding transcriptional regulator YdaS (Cro superfamily)